MYEFKGIFCRYSEEVERLGRQRWPSSPIRRFNESGVPLLAIRFPDIELWSIGDVEAAVAKRRVELMEWSRALPAYLFVFMSAECWGGDCTYHGYSFQNGTVVVDCPWTEDADSESQLFSLLSQLGLPEDRYFSPFTRGFDWSSASQ